MESFFAVSGLVLGLAAASLCAVVVLTNLWALFRSKGVSSLRLLVGPLFAAVAAGLCVQSGYCGAQVWWFALAVLFVDPAALPLLLWLWFRPADD